MVLVCPMIGMKLAPSHMNADLFPGKHRTVTESPSVRYVTAWTSRLRRRLELGGDLGDPAV